MSMKHPERHHKAAEKKRRLNRARIKNEIRDRRALLQAARDAKKALAGDDAPAAAEA